MSDERTEIPAAEDQAAARDATNWAKSVSRLKVSEVPEGAVNINVAGRRLASPIQGFGKMWQKTYQVRIPAERVSSTNLITAWKEHFPDFWPDGNRFYGPLTGIEPGEVALLNMTLPGKMKLSTGVMVLYADAESFTLMTPEGHMFAGWITFSATEVDGDTVGQAQVLMRASDPIFELGLTLGGHGQGAEAAVQARPRGCLSTGPTPWWSAPVRTGSPARSCLPGRAGPSPCSRAPRRSAEAVARRSSPCRDSSMTRAPRSTPSPSPRRF
jgi:hypothetical protein